MGLIKRDYLEDKGTLLIEKAPVTLHARRELPPPQPAAVLRVPPSDVPQAKTEAQKIIEKALQDAKAIKEEATEAGRREGREEASARLEEALATLNQAVKERKSIIKDAEGELLRLSLKIAEQIIVRVNREDAEYLKRFKDRLAGMMDGVKSFSILEDAGVEPGGCIIETNLGFVDARISTKLKAIEDALFKVAPEENG